MEISGNIAAVYPKNSFTRHRDYQVDPTPSAQSSSSIATRDATKSHAESKASPHDDDVLSDEEQREVEKLKSRDREVRAHENAHKAAAGSYARGGPHYQHQSGPDGRKYAVGGSVDIDTSPVRNDPQATIQKMQIVRRAALAPAEPSSQDRKVAAYASREMQKAQAELNKDTSISQSQDPTGTQDVEGMKSQSDSADTREAHSTYVRNDRPLTDGVSLIDVTV